MSALARIRAHGGDVIRSEWGFKLRIGRLSPDALAWLRKNWEAVCHEVWPPLGDWEERAAIREFDGGLARPEAERVAYAEVAGC